MTCQSLINLLCIKCINLFFLFTKVKQHVQLTSTTLANTSQCVCDLLAHYGHSLALVQKVGMAL